MIDPLMLNHFFRMARLAAIIRDDLRLLYQSGDLSSLNEMSSHTRSNLDVPPTIHGAPLLPS